MTLQRFLRRCVIPGAILIFLEGNVFSMQFSEDSLRRAAPDAPRLTTLFDQTFSKAGSLFRSHLDWEYFVGSGAGLRYCFEYGSKDSGDPLYAVIERSISSYEGGLPWRSQSEFNKKGMCVFVGPTPQDWIQKRGEDKFTVDAVGMDAERLCAYLSDSLRNIENPLRDTPSQLTGLADPDDHGPHDIYVLKDVTAGYSAPHLAPSDRRLHFSPSVDELRAIAGKIDESKTKTTPGSAQVLGSDYPLIARLESEYDRAVYPNSDISALQEECNRLLRESDSVLAKTGLQKILLATAWANEFRAGLLFNPQ